MQLLIALDRMTQLQPRVLKVQTTANQNDQKMGMPLQYCFSTLPLEFAADSFCRENVRLDELNMKKGIFYVLMTLVTNISQGLLCARKDKGITEIVVFAIAVLFFFFYVCTSTCKLYPNLPKCFLHQNNLLIIQAPSPGNEGTNHIRQVLALEQSCLQGSRAMCMVQK